jgi:hypothetical protein
VPGWQDVNLQKWPDFNYRFRNQKHLRITALYVLAQQV